MIGSTWQGMDGSLPNINQPILHAALCQTTRATTTTERGARIGAMNGSTGARSSCGATNTHDNKDNKRQQRYDGGHATGEPAEDGGSGQWMPWSVLVGEFKKVYLLI